MTGISDEQLMLLEQLTYLNKDIEGAAGLTDHGKEGTISKIDPHSTIADLINKYDQEALDQLRVKGNDKISSEMTGNEVAAIIEAIRDDEELMSLELQKKDESSGTYCFTDSNGEAIVMYRGTASGDEWVDNFIGLGTSDTEIQKKTHDFIEGLPYDDITVVGHSKGGNKAMYVAIVSDKVSRAVSMDGQGFSQEFLHKYEEEIRQNASKITNYSLDADFVHILLYQVPGSKQTYIDGNDYVNQAKNHCSANLFWFREENGKLVIDRDANGQIDLHTTTENPGMTYLHGFTIFVLENCPVEDRKVIGNYLGNILACFMRPGVFSFTDDDGTVYNSDNYVEYIFKHPESLGLILGYIIKYAETYNLNEEQLWSLIVAMGLEDTVLLLSEGIAAFAIADPERAAALGLAGLSIFEILKLVMSNIVDGKVDPLLEVFLSWLNEMLSSKLGIPLNLDRLWRSIEKSYSAIGDIDPATGKLNTMDSENRIFDYSEHTYSALLENMQKVDNYTSGSISNWNHNYSSEKWFNDLRISLFVDGIESYGTKIREINAYCRSQVYDIFEKVWSIDQNKSRELAEHREQIETITQSIRKIAENIG